MQAHWVVAVKEPSAADIEAAFEVFNEQQLGGAIHTMPQVCLLWGAVGGLRGEMVVLRHACVFLYVWLGFLCSRVLACPQPQ